MKFKRIIAAPHSNADAVNGYVSIWFSYTFYQMCLQVQPRSHVTFLNGIEVIRI